MTPIEVLATVFAVAILVKLVFVAASPKTYLRLVDAMAANTKLVSALYLVMAAIIGYYVLAEFTIVQVAAVIMFVMPRLGLAWAPHLGKFLGVVREAMGQPGEALKRNWLSVIIWGAMAVWVLYSLYL